MYSVYEGRCDLKKFCSLQAIVDHAEAQVSRVSIWALYCPERIPFATWYQSDLEQISADQGVSGAQCYQVAALIFLLYRMSDEARYLRLWSVLIALPCFFGMFVCSLGLPFPNSVVPAIGFLAILWGSSDFLERKYEAITGVYRSAVARLGTCLATTSTEVFSVATFLINEPRGAEVRAEFKRLATLERSKEVVHDV